MTRQTQNLLLVAVRRKRWGETPALTAAIEALRRDHPTGSAILNYVAGADSGNRSAWFRYSDFALIERPPIGGPVHLGTAHLFEASGLRTLPVRLLLRRASRDGGDFERHGNALVRSVSEAAMWLHERLARGPLVWTRDGVRAAIEGFVAPVSLPSVAWAQP